MPTATFERFLAQLNAQGRDKADGFDRSHFDGMTGEERGRARALLRAALDTGDSSAVGGLTLLDPTDASELFRRALGTGDHPDSTRITIAGALLRTEGSATAQQSLVDALQARDPVDRRLALNLLAAGPPSRALVPALRDYVNRESVADNRAIGAEILLYWSGAISTLDESYTRYGRMLDAIEDGSVFARRAALHELSALTARTGT